MSASVALAQTGARYLIITHDDYYSALEPLACWKTQKGVRAKIATLSETGSDSIAIKAYITSAYNTWQIRPEYLLLVGNKYQLPFPRFVTAGVTSYSDNYYANVVGDFRNELYHGRLWVSDTVEAKTAVAKILSYEKNPPVMFDSLWYRKGVTIVNEWEQGQPSSALLYWADARFAHQHMLDANFAHIDSFSYELGNDNIDVLNAINEGRTYMLYRGIGGGDWIWPFGGVSPAQMDNGYRMPVVLSATCATVEGIGQDWTVAGTPTQPKGVIAFFGTTTNLFEASEMRSALCRGTTASLFSDTGSIGVAAEAGRLEYYAQFNDLVEYHSWMCLGDPEMFMWKSTPKTILVEHNAHFTTGICTASVYVQNNSMPTRDALVCVMAKLDTSFYHYGYTDDIGSFQFIDTLHIPGDSVFITVTGRDLKPYYDTRPVFYVGGPYVRLYSYTTLDSLGGNGDDIINPGEDIELPFCLRNWGDATAYGIVATLEKATSSVPCTLHDTTKYVGDIMPYESVSVHPDGYNVLIDEDCPDLQEIALSIRIEDATTATWTSDLGFTVHAPVLSYHDYYFDQHVKYTNPGDTSEFYVAFLNTGSYKAENPVATISSSDSLIEIIDSAASFQTIHADSIAWNSSDPFIITAADNAPNGYSTIVTVHVTSGVYTTTCSLAVHMGQKDYFVWDPDINQSSGPVIDSLLNSLHFSGEYSTAFPYGFLSLYKSVYVCAGVWPLDYLIIDTSQSGYEIERYLEIENGNVYLEGGDVWYHPLVNHGYDFGPLFGIHLVYNTIGLLNAINGRANTFTQNMTFRYQGEATMLDCIDTTGGSQLIFEKANSLLACGVAANNRTVGVSFELSGLVDTIVPSTKADLLAAIMNYFGVSPTSVTEQGSVWRQELALLVHPNPSRYGCNIDLQALGTEKITLKVYDVSGRCVTTLIDGMMPGDEQQTFFWNRLDEKNRKVPAGVYFVRLETNNTAKTIKTVLLN